ncbi:hypothetical protein EYF80_006733 [Liparis tanakae]|uniref:Uncharacterized protein n=1 Tax=Liparis tanakae TaxID=230148 RepID=A0A4Z2IZ12_9TELE|nr:hypothetical protein EYF80_006733 [Liparis tanakae]
MERVVTFGLDEMVEGEEAHAQNQPEEICEKRLELMFILVRPRCLSGVDRAKAAFMGMSHSRSDSSPHSSSSYHLLVALAHLLHFEPVDLAAQADQLPGQAVVLDLHVPLEEGGGGGEGVILRTTSSEFSSLSTSGVDAPRSSEPALSAAGLSFHGRLCSRSCHSSFSFSVSAFTLSRSTASPSEDSSSPNALKSIGGGNSRELRLSGLAARADWSATRSRASFIGR